MEFEKGKSTAKDTTKVEAVADPQLTATETVETKKAAVPTEAKKPQKATAPLRAEKPQGTVKAVTKKPERKRLPSISESVEEVEEPNVYFVLLEKYIKSHRTLGGYTDKIGVPHTWRDVKYSGGAPVSEAPYLGKGRLIVPKVHKDLIAYIKGHPECEGSPNKKGPARFKLLDMTADDATNVKTENMVLAAKFIAMNLDAYDLESVALVLGKFARNDNTMRASVYKYIDESPEKFSKMFNINGALTEYHAMFALIKRGQFYKVFEHKKDGVYYNNAKLGKNDSESASFLVDNTGVAENILDDISKA